MSDWMEAPTGSPARRSTKFVATLLLTVLIAVLLPITAASPASAAPSAPETSALEGASLSVGQGAIVLGLAAGPSLDLGAPATETVTQGIIPLLIGGGAACGLIKLFSDSGCLEKAAELAWGVATGVLSEALKAVIHQFNGALRGAAKSMSEFVIINELGSESRIARPDVNTEWFLGQYSLMRTIGLFLIVPLMMLVIIQSIVRGSLFLLLRAALIMLPTAVLGSVVLVKFTDLMLDIADDFSAAIGNNLMSVSGYGQNLNAAIDNMSDESFGIFAWIWMFFFIVAAIVIYIELILRQTGIYLAAFFLPLGFSALVWPATAKWAKRLVELLLALIFSKVFIVAAVSIGMAAVASGGITAEPLGPNPTGDQVLQQTETGVAAIAGGAAILIMACFAGTKILAYTPGAMAATEGRVADTAKLWGKGQVLQAGMGQAYGHYAKKAGNIQPNASFSNSGAGGGGGGGTGPKGPGPKGGGGTPTGGPRNGPSPNGTGGGGTGGGGGGQQFSGSDQQFLANSGIDGNGNGQSGSLSGGPKAPTAPNHARRKVSSGSKPRGAGSQGAGGNATATASATNAVSAPPPAAGQEAPAAAPAPRSTPPSRPPQGQRSPSNNSSPARPPTRRFASSQANAPKGAPK